MVIVGDGEAKREIAERVKAMSSVSLLPPVPHEEVADYYAAADLVVYPRLSTRATELVTPLKPLEAMAMGKAILASGVGGLRELLTDGKTARLLPAGDATALAEACVELLGEAALRDRLGAQARERVVAHHQWRQVAERYREPLRLPDGAESMTGDLLFWLGLAALGYAYVGYPLLLGLLAPVFGQAFRQAEQEPSVSLIVAAHNESEVIGEKLANTLSLDYPADRLQLIVISDASTDSTEEIVRGCSDPRVALLRQEQQGGKSAALNRGVEAATGEVLVFSDANSMFAPGAVRALVRRFADPKVGAVSGELVYEADQAHTGEGIYWRYEQVVKALESRMGRLLGANGAIFAMRRELVPQLHPLDVNDFRLPYQALLEGRAAVLAREATATERAAPSPGGEMARKVRIMSRALPMFFSLFPRTLRAGRPLVAWQLLSHKILREVQAVFFLAMLVGAVWSDARRVGAGAVAAGGAACWLRPGGGGVGEPGVAATAAGQDRDLCHHDRDHQRVGPGTVGERSEPGDVEEDGEGEGRRERR